MHAIEHDTRAKRFSIVIDGLNAELDYQVSGTVMTIYRTVVPPPISGRGVAADLMRAAVTEAKTQGWSVNPTCSYAAAYLQRHPDEGLIRHREELLDEALDESFPASDPPARGGSN